jgi:hypothetical protein
VSNGTFSNISAISWRPVFVVEEAGVPGENHPQERKIKKKTKNPTLSGKLNMKETLK